MKSKMNFKLLVLFAIIGAVWVIIQAFMIFDFCYEISLFGLIFNKSDWSAHMYSLTKALPTGQILFDVASREILTIIATLFFILNIAFVVYVGFQFIPFIINGVKEFINKGKKIVKDTMSTIAEPLDETDYVVVDKKAIQGKKIEPKTIPTESSFASEALHIIQSADAPLYTTEDHSMKMPNAPTTPSSDARRQL